MKDYQLGQMDKQKDKPASLPREKFTKADKEFVKNKYDKDTLKRRKGMAQARSKLGEAKKPVVHSDKPDSLKTVKIKYNKPLSNEEIYIKTNSKKMFMPAKKYRGYIARSAMYFLSTYPELQ